LGYLLRATEDGSFYFLVMSGGRERERAEKRERNVRRARWTYLMNQAFTYYDFLWGRERRRRRPNDGKREGGSE
jgi:hypothetical protein